ncbi:MAG: MFS transporter [Propionibacteriaceae bacterium]|jgi:OFA family oxalate/formate antiporter-like MFS transporter|nr:MFS transporter [Propionibacteriaceae bacterium]
MSKLHAAKVRYNFGRKGSVMIGYSIILLFFMTGLTVDGLNIIVPGFAAIKGWNQDQLLSIATPASIVALVLTSLWSLVVKRLGAKNATSLAFLLAAGSVAAFGVSVDLWMYAITLTLMITFINCFSVIGGYAMIANWFPRKKGIVLGFSTMGMNLASASIPALLTVFSRVATDNPDGDVTHALFVFAGILAVTGLLNQALVKDNPEAAGCYPDNEPAEEDAIEEPSREGDKTGLTYTQAVRNPKILALGFVYGLTGMGTVGVMSQLIPYLTAERGFTQESAISTMTAAALIGVFGSWVWGVIDQRWGTKLATQLFGVWFALAIVALITPTQEMLYLGIFMIGMGIGGNGNFPPSMVTQVCGRHDFPIAFGVVNAICGVVRSLAFVVLALVRSATGSTANAYIAFIFISLLGTLVMTLVKVKGQDQPLAPITVAAQPTKEVNHA